MPNMYENPIFTRLPDQSLHPGGLRLTDRAVRLAALRPGMLVADVGCGAGSTAAYLVRKYGLDMVGLEISSALVERGLRDHPGARLIRWDCRTLPLGDSVADALLLECTLSVIGRHAETLAHCARVLKPSGTLILSDVCSKAPQPKKYGAPPTAQELESLLAAAGFRVAVSEDHTPALRTYAAQLWACSCGSGGVDTPAGWSGCSGARLSDLAYRLIIATKA